MFGLTNLCLGFSFQGFASFDLSPGNPLPGDPTCGCLVGTCLGSGDLCPSVRAPVTGGSMEPWNLWLKSVALRGGCCDPFPVGCWLMLVDDGWWWLMDLWAKLLGFKFFPPGMTIEQLPQVCLGGCRGVETTKQKMTWGRKDFPLWSSLLWEAGISRMYSDKTMQWGYLYNNIYIYSYTVFQTICVSPMIWKSQAQQTRDTWLGNAWASCDSELDKASDLTDLTTIPFFEIPRAWSFAISSASW